MLNRKSFFSIRVLAGWIFSVMTFILAGGVWAEPYAVGERIEPFTLEDQHGKRFTIDDSVSIVLFSRDMDGGKRINEALEELGNEALSARNAVYIADISGMPKLVARMFALPAMRKRPYSIMLDRNGETMQRFSSQEGKGALIYFDQLVITRIVHASKAEEVVKELESQ